jgi:HAD superfamily hydrolase (TIGR01509 family)
MKADRQFGGVIFDMDGVLINSEPKIRLCAQETAEEIGYTISNAAYISWMGLPSRDLRLAIQDTMGPEFPMDIFYERYRENWDNNLEKNGMKAQPGMPELLHHLKECGVPFSVATSTDRLHALKSLEISGLLPFIKSIIGGDQVTRGKPDPEIFLRAAELINVPSSQCIALEDTPIGVKAAASAGMFTIMVPDVVAPDSVLNLCKYVLPSTRSAARVITKLFSS